MTVTDLRRNYDYSCWANERLFQAISGLTVDEFTRPVAGSYGSVRNTMVHIMSAEWGWLSRCGGLERGARLDPADYPTQESLINSWENVERYMRAFLAGMQDVDLTREIEFEIGGFGKHTMSVGELLQHAINHGVHHRGQAALLIRMLGYAPGNFDILFYFAEQRGKSLHE